MINIISSNAPSQSDVFNKVEREEGEDNIKWLRRNMPTESDQTLLVMVGGRSPTDFRLRIAQSHVRSDLAPSCWSHVMLLHSTGEDLVRLR